MLKVREIHCKRWLLKDKIAGIVLYPFIFYNTSNRLYKEDFETLKSWEWEHIKQIRDMGFLSFYLNYIFNFSFRSKVEDGHRR